VHQRARRATRWRASSIEPADCSPRSKVPSVPTAARQRWRLLKARRAGLRLDLHRSRLRPRVC
jgi:hypothetical protein